MDGQFQITEASTEDDIEMVMVPSLTEALRKESEERCRELEILKQVDLEYDKRKERFHELIAGYKEVNEEDRPVPKNVLLQFLDKAYGKEGALIQPSHDHLDYSFLNLVPSLKEYIPKSSSLAGVFGHSLFDKNAPRQFEAIQEYNAENTKRAYNSDLLYWQAWLSSVGFSFNEPINESHVNAFIVQHAQGMDPFIDEKLVEQGFKYEVGTHRMSTIRRRIVSLRIFLKLENLPNPCESPKIKMLISKLTKKYGGSKSKGKAITKDILDDFLATCGDKLIDVRDKAILLFAWSSGGRRRSEVTDAKIEDLSRTEDGDFLYRVPKNKTDQEGEGFVVPIKGRAAHALSQWLEASQVVSGSIFRSIGKNGLVAEKGLSPIDVFRVVRKRAELAGYNPKQFGAHSLRSGFVTEGGKRGKPLGDVMSMTGHKSVGIAMGYYKAGSAINNSAANLAD